MKGWVMKDIRKFINSYQLVRVHTKSMRKLKMATTLEAELAVKFVGGKTL